MQRVTITTPAGPMAALVWDGAAGKPWLHFAHATGMNAELYARLLGPLADDFRIIASDARGHGVTGLPKDPASLASWDDFARDLLGLIDTVAPDVPWLLAGHSMGAAVSLRAAHFAPMRVNGLVLTDPAMIPFAMAREALASGTTPPNPMADQALRRRADFASRAEARAAWAGRGVFRSWHDADLDAYIAGGMVDTADGVTLACTPAFEAATFRAVSLEIEPALAALTVPFALIAGETGSTVRDEDFATFAAHPQCLLAERLPGTSHFVPLERPETVRDAVRLVARGERQA